MPITRRQVCAPLLSALLPWPAAEAAAGPDPHERLARIAARYFADKMALDPLAASATVGGAQYEGRLAITIAPAEVGKARALNRRVAADLRALPAQRLAPADRLNHELLAWEVQLRLDGAAYPGHLMPIDQFGALPLDLANLGSGDQYQPLKTPADYGHYLHRLKRLRAFNRQAIANMREGIRRGYTVPRALVDSGLPIYRSLAEPVFDKSPFARALAVMPPAFSSAERARISRAWHATFERDLLPAMRELVAFLEGPYRRACRSSAGISALPNGAAWYAHQVRANTTTNMAPDEIHALGLAEVARIHAEMAKVQAGFGVEGSVTDFLRWHAAQARFRPYGSWPELLKGYEAINQRVLPLLPRLFGRLPKYPMDIRPMPELQRATASPYYTGPAPDGSRPGVFYVGAGGEPAQFNVAIMTSLLLHEGQPGHHFQGSRQIEMDLPDFRRWGWNSAFGEGWALYAETLGIEMGVYDDPTQYLGHLKQELHRAVRLVTDTGLHAKVWTREETMRYMMDTEGASEAQARQATERYMAWPGQALAYKIGALKIRQMRQHAQSRLGERFSLPAFHELMLSQGTPPLKVLERLVDEWIAADGGTPVTAASPG
jgi:uncharacterized protein (DUF885 family)